MAIEVKLKRNLGDFQLDIHFKSEHNRIGVLGASGCGKSMTLKSIAGVEAIDEGYIEINGQVLYDTKIRKNTKPQQRNIGYLFQNYALFPTKTVEGNIMAGLHGNKKEKQLRVKEMIAKFQLCGLEKRLPGELSGGQQQRVALARIMAYEPDVILLDEPFSALDGYLKDKLQQEMSQMLEEYKGIVILVSHNRDEIYRFCKDLLIMNKGKAICFGDTKTLFKNPQNQEAARLTGCKNIVEIRKLDDYTFEIPAWQTIIRSKKALPDEIRYIGYRAHDFIPLWGEEKENCIPFHLKSIAELPFEKQFFLKGKGNEDICWFVQKNQSDRINRNGMPDFLQINIEKILYLV
jgi:molybdate transport system ATP-binding protein